MFFFIKTLLSFMLLLSLVCSAPITERASKGDVSIIVPLYSYPAPGAWDPLYAAIKKYPKQHFTVIVNPNSGPGSTQFPDASYIAGIAKLNQFRNVQTVGYVHTSYATRKMKRVNADIALYAGWAKYTAADIHVNGIFLDEAPSTVGKKSANLDYMKATHAVIKKQFKASSGISARVITNPGIICDKAFYNYADTIVSFEEPLDQLNARDTYFTNKDKSLSYGVTPRKQAIIIYDYNKSQDSMKSVVKKVVGSNVGEFFITTYNDYNQFSRYLQAFVTDVVRANGVASATSATSAAASYVAKA